MVRQACAVQPQQNHKINVQWKSMFDGTRLWRGIASTGRVAPPSKCPRAPEEVSPFPHALLGQQALHPSLSSTPIMHLCVRPYLYVCVFVCVLVVPLIVMFLRAPRAATGPAAPAQCARRYLSLECEPCLYRKAPFASPQVCPAVWFRAPANVRWRRPRSPAQMCPALPLDRLQTFPLSRSSVCATAGLSCCVSLPAWLA